MSLKISFNIVKIVQIRIYFYNRGLRCKGHASNLNATGGNSKKVLEI